ncbi:hypothetical protein HU200_030163 [Digitaria exilis]|uniref:CRIB domain-containing protein n=1 Tax=Digitaria exilis TaxID=1010633 RepID=A0A835BXW7_9POAL|nr:hypothetical protein HU200_030163 [Digitaria exilis]CAB3492481.1 unnamed protein product [Digitaria exilis]
MKDRRGSSSGGGDRFVVFPFSMGCMSQSAVSVADPRDKKQQSDPSSSSSSAAATTTTAQTAGSEDGAGETVKTAAAAGTPASPGLVAAGVSRLMKGIKSLSLMFAGEEDDDGEEDEPEMVIGYPTDVQHVGHIGWDGHNKVGAAMGMVNAFSLPSSLSLRHLEMAMDQAAHA